MKMASLLVGVEFQRNGANIDDSLSELEQLADTAGFCTIDKVIQKIEKPNPKFFIGSGKVLKIKNLCELKKIDAVIFDEELTPAQQRNLEEDILVRVIDRTQLILNIFAQRARTLEAKLQVELAGKVYQLPRLTGKGTTLAQQTGGIGLRSGFGEKKLETDRRRLRDRISYLKTEIEKIKYNREIQRSKRQEVPLPIVSLVGYTNVGKSTLLNYLVNAYETNEHHVDKHRIVYADDKLFATLDPTTRKIKLSTGKFVLFTDTVGFIKKLPHQLVAAFKSTIEEITKSNLIIHIVDISNPNHKSNEETVSKVLKEIKADKIPIINVYNKCDLLSNDFSHLESNFCVSAKTGKGIVELLCAISTKLESNLKHKKISLPYNLLSVVNKIKSVGKIISYKHREKYIELEFLIDDKNWGQIKNRIKN